MKKTYSYIVLTLLASLVLTGCYDDNEYADNLSLGATVSVSGDEAFILGETDQVDIQVSYEENSSAPIQNIIMEKQLLTSEGNSDVVTQTFPANEDGEIDLSFTSTELFADVPVNGITLDPEDLSPGDRWQFDFKVEMADGRILTPGRSDGKLSVNFTCQSDLAGTYSTVTDGGTGDGSGGTASSFTDLAHEVTITEVSAGRYQLSDITGGLYALIYGDEDNPVEFTDICNQISVDSQPDVVYGGDEFNGTGTVNDDGTITITWSNNWGDNGTTVLTPL